MVENIQTVPLKYHLTSFDEVSETKIQGVIMLSPSKTCGLDPNLPQNLKENIESIASTQTRILNLSILTGTIPSSFKRVLVTTPLKKHRLTTTRLKLTDQYQTCFCVEGPGTCSSKSTDKPP